MVLDVNTRANIVLTAKLEKMKKSAFPMAVRSTLNDAAFQMKKSEILSSAKKNMKVRNPTVFKKFTGVNVAKGFDIERMRSEVGFIPKDGAKGNKIPSGMEANEEGGVDKKGFMYLAKTRGNGSRSRGLVKRNSRFNRAKVLGSSKSRNTYNESGVNSRFMNDAYDSYKQKKAFHFYTKKGYFLVQAASIKRGADGNSKVKLNFLMRGRKDFNARAKPTHFNKEAAIKTSKMLESFYYKNANYQFKKVFK